MNKKLNMLAVATVKVDNNRMLPSYAKDAIKVSYELISELVEKVEKLEKELAEIKVGTAV